VLVSEEVHHDLRIRLRSDKFRNTGAKGPLCAVRVHPDRRFHIAELGRSMTEMVTYQACAATVKLGFLRIVIDAYFLFDCGRLITGFDLLCFLWLA
jgi:hypothetical protein